MQGRGRRLLEVWLATRWYEEMSVGAGSSGSSSRSSTDLIDLVQNASLRIFSHCAAVSTHRRTATESLGSKQLRSTGQPRATAPAAPTAPTAPTAPAAPAAPAAPGTPGTPATLHRPLGPLAAASASAGDGGMGGGGVGGGGGGPPPTGTSSFWGIATTSAGGLVSRMQVLTTASPTTSAGGLVSSAVASAPVLACDPNSLGGIKPLTCRSRRNPIMYRRSRFCATQRRESIRCQCTS
jgi:hypothetical protein